IFNQAGASLTVINSTFASNAAVGGRGARGLGGAIFNPGGTGSLTNAPLPSNVIDNGHGADPYNLADEARPTASPTPLHTTLGNQQLAGVAETTASGPNLVSVGIPALGGTVNQSGVITADPLLAPLGDYGGPTRTRPLLPGSPAIDAAGADAPDADQRGVS